MEFHAVAHRDHDVFADIACDFGSVGHVRHVHRLGARRERDAHQAGGEANQQRNRTHPGHSRSQCPPAVVATQ